MSFPSTTRCKYRRTLAPIHCPSPVHIRTYSSQLPTPAVGNPSMAALWAIVCINMVNLGRCIGVIVMVLMEVILRITWIVAAVVVIPMWRVPIRIRMAQDMPPVMPVIPMICRRIIRFIIPPPHTTISRNSYNSSIITIHPITIIRIRIIIISTSN